MVTLMMACMFVVGWVRSLSMLHLETLATWNSFWRITLEDGVAELSRYQCVSGGPPHRANAEKAIGTTTMIISRKKTFPIGSDQ